jgi:hypothetical protein
MNEIALALFAFLALLLPIATYCFVLAAINRRSRPLMVRGAWDAVGLVFALSGFFTASVPVLAFEFIRRVLGSPDLGLDGWLWLVIYFAVVVCVSVLMIVARARKTVIYNVDPEQFAHTAHQTFAAQGLLMKLDGKRLILTPAERSPGDVDVNEAVMEARPRPAPSEDRRYAEVSIENFASMCNVTLHWGPCSPGLRDQLENALDKNLDAAAPLDNGAAGWFVSVSGMIFGAVLVIVAMFVFMIVFSRRWE